VCPIGFSLCVAQGRSYLCKKLDLERRLAIVRPADLKYYTKTRDFTDISIVGGRTAYGLPAVAAPEGDGRALTPTTAQCADAVVSPV
jgi:ATP-dependent helicase YprA (DUF1998 family)